VHLVVEQIPAAMKNTTCVSDKVHVLATRVLFFFPFFYDRKSVAEGLSKLWPPA